ncbi:hypothetical protein BRARA_B01991 [Brassica rapa]|uniref:Uncharacterized protein n=1 Tax=Brassica campestris TaxID=3711 RepID=A0A398AI21_BRACM|nr:hypothetical protein BRARA_B01991 [Brassica rapa]
MIDSFESSDYTAKLWAQLQILPSSPSHQINPELQHHRKKTGWKARKPTL